MGFQPKKMMRRALAPMLVVPAMAYGQTLSCYEEPSTLKNTCFNPRSVLQNGDLRSVELFHGGPKGVERVGLTLVVNCARRIATLQDHRGVNISGNRTNATPLVEALTSWICAVKNTKRSASIRMF